MAFRWGSEGRELWSKCRELGIAAIGYYGERWRPIVKEFSKMPRAKYDAAWRRGQPGNTAGQSSLWRFAREMDRGDIIYVKQGTSIVGKGVVLSDYRYQPGVMRDPKCRWEHYRRVDWDPTFKTVPLLLGAEPFTVLPLNETRLGKIERATHASALISGQMEMREGEVFRSEAAFRKRNSALIASRKAQSDYRCEVCGLTFEKVYGDIGREHIVAHHLKPIGARKRASMTRLDDIALVCSNCHDMLHRHGQLLSIAELRRRMGK